MCSKSDYLFLLIDDTKSLSYWDIRLAALAILLAEKIWGNLYKHEKKYNEILPKNVLEPLIIIWRKESLYPLFSFAQETEISPPLSTVMLDNEKSQL